MKKSLFVLLAASALTLVACGETPASSPEGGEGERTSRTSRTPRPSSDQSGQSTPESTPEASTSALPALDGTDVFYSKGIYSGGETTSVAFPGRLYYWSGDGGNITSFEKAANGDYVLEYVNATSPDSGWGWYGCQVFYTAPYAQGGENYEVRFVLNSDIAGDITINGTVCNLVRGDNIITHSWLRGSEGVKAATFAIQLGTSAGTALRGSMIRFKSIEIFEKANTYHHVKFVDGDKVVKDIQVLANKTVTAPRLVYPSGKVLAGWFDGSNEFDQAANVTADRTYSSKYVDESAGYKTVSIKNGFGQVFDTIKLATGSKFCVAFEDIAVPVGYKVTGFFADAQLTQAFNLSTVINNDMDLFGQYLVNPIIWINSGEAGWTFHDEISYSPEGALRLNFPGWGGAAWHVQANIIDLPVGESGKNYKLEITYLINQEGANVQLFYNDNTPIGEATNLVVSQNYQKASVVYAGGSVASTSKFSIQLGSITKDAPVAFELAAVSFTEVA